MASMEALSQATAGPSALDQLLMQGSLFLVEHGSTVVISTLVFVVWSLLTRLFTTDNDSMAKKGTEPTPRWDVLRVMNYVVVAVFVGSITYVVFNYRRAMSYGGATGNGMFSSMFFPIVVLWTCCLAYFFGFFGISFLDTNAISRSPSTFGLQDLQRMQPINDTPICAEKPRVRTASLAKTEEVDFPTLSDEEVLAYAERGILKDHQLEQKLGNHERAVNIRRQLYERRLGKSFDLIPFSGYNYEKVFGANCEIVIGYVPLPLGVVGPLMLNGEPLFVPMATTEGCLVASTNRGCKAITQSGGAAAMILKDSITRAPCIRFDSAVRATELKFWLEDPVNYAKIEAAFNSTTNYGRLDGVTTTIAGRNAFLRFRCMSGDAMGMNMVSKGCLKAIEIIQEVFPDSDLVAISGNMCTDKKPAAINWIEGRGKSIVVEAVIPASVVTGTLKTTVSAMIETNKQKNLIGSAMAGSVGGFNAHAANIVTAVFLATGQDPAQNVESSNCITLMEYAPDGESLHVSVTMPSVEVGTVGGGTHLPAQAGCLDMLGVRGANKTRAGDNSRKLALIVGGAVLAGELSLMAALAANHLVRSHMQHNRKPQST